MSVVAEIRRALGNAERLLTMKKLRFGVVGAGAARGQWWIGTISRLSDHLELIGICEPVKGRQAENHERWKVPIYNNLKEMMEADKPDAVLCAVPPDGNPAIAHMAARHGIHVVSEIPVAPTLQLTELMASVAEAHNVKLEIAENVYRWPAERLKQRIIAAGHIGKVLVGRLSYITGSYHGFNAVRALMGWKATRVLGVSHDLHYPFHDDYMQRDLVSHRWNAGVIQFENGSMCLFEKPCQGGCGQQMWSVEGDLGNVAMDTLILGKSETPKRLEFKSEYVLKRNRNVLKRMWVDTDIPVQYENPYAEYGIGVAEDLDEVARADILVGFHNAVINDKAVPYAPPVAWGDQELVNAIEQSHLQGNKWVTLPLARGCEIEAALHDAYREMYGSDPSNVEALMERPLPRGGVRSKVLGDM